MDADAGAAGSDRLGAECLGLDAEIGTLEKGKLADLIVVSGDPLSDITTLQKSERIVMVMKNGEICDRSAAHGASAARF
ncbi:MAG: amidohydrolase family protein [Pseudomonadota bacterium]